MDYACDKASLDGFNFLFIRVGRSFLEEGFLDMLSELYQ